MRIVQVAIKNFRGIKSLDWHPRPGVTCLVGPGDSGKTTILDAVEFALFPRNWLQFTEADFFQLNTNEPIEITITATELPSGLLTQEKFGLHLRGWSEHANEIHDEPGDEDVPALTVRLQVDESLEPVWHVTNDRLMDGRVIGARDRELIGAVRFGNDIDRQLTWTRGSALTRVIADPDAIGTALAEAHREARNAVGALQFETLTDVATSAGEQGQAYGADLSVPLRVGVDPRQLGVGGGSLNLIQADGTPVRSTGLGTRRLLALAIQRQAADATLLALIDEVEHGLEPHRVRHLLRELSASGSQYFLTSHSDVVVAELGATSLQVVRRDQQGVVQVHTPEPDLQPVIRSTPQAMLARRIVVCEGKTEVGISRALVKHWDQKMDRPLAACGTIFINGRGTNTAPQTARNLRKLGFDCVVWIDSDTEPTPSSETLNQEGIDCVMWADRSHTEGRIATDATEEMLERIWMIAASAGSPKSISDQIATVNELDGEYPSTWSGWVERFGLHEMRKFLGKTAHKSGWFKNISSGEELGTTIVDFLPNLSSTDLARKIEELKNLAYGN